MFVGESESATDSLKLIGACRILTTRHSGCQIVGNDDGDVGILVDSIKQSCHSGMCEGGVADNGNGRPLSGIRSSLSHCDRSTHINTRMDGFVRWQETECVATDITKDPGIGIVEQHLIEGCIDVTMATALTECRWTRYHIFARGKAFVC